MKLKYFVILCVWLLPAGMVYAQSKNISGVVKDAADGSPLAGVAVQVGRTADGTATDANGEYSLAVAVGDSLHFTFIGKKPVSRIVGQRNVIEVVMYDDEEMLDEVTVVAFGTQKKESVVASISTVKVSDLRVPASNLTTALAGRIPGMIAYQTSGEPGADNAQFFIRGVTTFGYKKDPLYLIDGFEAVANDVARLRVDDIESFSILKDASATVLYGSRAANGIVIITTKGGREGPAKLSIRLDNHIATPTRVPKMVDGVEYMRLYNEASVTREPLLGTFYSEQKIQSTAAGENPMVYPNVDWYNELFRKSTMNTKAHIDVSGGGQVATYYVSGGYERETGLLKTETRNNFSNNININRFSIRTNVIFKLTRTTTLDTRINGYFEKYTGPYVPASQIFNDVMTSNPVDFPAVYAPDAARQHANYILFGSTFVNAQLKVNPYAQMVRGYENRDESNITAMVTLTQDLAFLTPGLKVEVKGSVNPWTRYSQRRTYQPFFFDLDTYNQITDEYTLWRLNPQTAQSTLGNVEPGRDASFRYYFEGRAVWGRMFGKHNLGATLVGTLQEYLRTGGNTTSIFEALPERNLGLAGRVSYDFDSRYFLEAPFGYNGSEKFAASHRFGFFPAVAGGWIVSNEAFWEPMQKWVSRLKLKGSYGIVGNDAIAGAADRFFFLSDLQRGDAGTATNSGYRWGTSWLNAYGGYRFNRYANPDISWEISHEWNTGLEIGLLNDALTIEAELFGKDRRNIYMMRQNFPSTFGMDAPLSGNVGRLKAQGFDGSIDYRHSFTKDFFMTGRANLTYADNRLVELDEKDFPDEYLKRKGHNLDQQWGLIAERLFVDEQEVANSPRQDFGEYLAGDIKYKDVNGDGTVNANDAVPMGYPTAPMMQYGFGLSAGYKDFDFSFFFQGNAMVSLFIDAGGNAGIGPFYNRRNALEIVARDYWTESDPDVHAFWPRLSTNWINNNMQLSSWWLRDGSFTRLKSCELGWTPSMLKIKGLQSLRLYLSGENLLELSKFKLWDPEMGRSGLGYPPNRRYNIGLLLNF